MAAARSARRVASTQPRRMMRPTNAKCQMPLSEDGRSKTQAFEWVDTHDSVSEWLRRWTRNPLGSAREGSNPFAVAFCLITVNFCQICVRMHTPNSSLCCNDAKSMRRLSCACHKQRKYSEENQQFCPTFLHDNVSEWLRRWTRNPLGSAREGSNPFVVALTIQVTRAAPQDPKHRRFMIPL